MILEGFTFNGKHSSSFGISNVRVEASLFIQEFVIGDAELIEGVHPFDFRTHLYKTRRAPIEFTLQLALLGEGGVPGKWTEAKIKEVYSWLLHNEYKELFFDERPSTRFYVLASSGMELFTIRDTGYLTISFRTNSPYPWGQKRTFNFTGSSSMDTTKQIDLSLDPLAFPKNYFKAVLTRISSGTASSGPLRVFVQNQPVVSNTIALDQAKLTGLDTVTFNGENRTVSSGLEQVFKHRLLTSGTEFPYLTKGINTITVPKGWNLKIEFQFPVLR